MSLMLSRCKSPPNLKTALWVALERSQTKPRENIACQIYEFCRHLSMWSIPGNLLVWVHVSTYVVSKQVKFFFLYEKEEAKWGDLHCQISPFFSVCCDFNSRVQFFTHKRLYPLCLDDASMAQPTMNFSISADAIQNLHALWIFFLKWVCAGAQKLNVMLVEIAWLKLTFRLFANADRGFLSCLNWKWNFLLGKYLNILTHLFIRFHFFECNLKW